MKNYEEKISMFLDNELPVDEQPELFAFLSESEDGRKALNDYMELQSSTRSFFSEMEVDLPALELPKDADYNKPNYFKPLFYFSAAASIILAMLLFFSPFSDSQMITKYSELQRELIDLQESYKKSLQTNIDLIKRNDEIVSQIQKADQQRNEREVIQVSRQKNSEPNSAPKINPQAKQLTAKKNNYLASVPTYKITDDDFIGRKIIGN
ncbi:MAG: hypothetical protein K9N07_09645 [Candidatus Cloacimonetes bacterium]|nr:hypothetical protein [Candidatus Cloacimonadota bacterium]